MQLFVHCRIGDYGVDGIDPAKVTTVHNAVEPLSEELKNIQVPKSKEKVVTFLGRITMQKGPSILVSDNNSPE